MRLQGWKDQEGDEIKMALIATLFLFRRAEETGKRWKQTNDPTRHPEVRPKCLRWTVH